MQNQDSSKTAVSAPFERKILRAKLATVFEQLWVRTWLLLAVFAAFLLISYAGIWPTLGSGLHIALLSAFGIALLAAITSMARVNWPKRDEAIRRLEKASGVPHRPASSYEDTLTASASSPETQALWQAHRDRMARLLKRLTPGTPAPRTDRFDPYAVRAAALLAVVVSTGLLGDTAWERITSAFQFSHKATYTEARLDAWITPPPYSARPPVMLADGSGSKAQAAPETRRVELATSTQSAGSSTSEAPEVPEHSALIVRASGIGSSKLSIEIDTGEPGAKSASTEILTAEPPKDKRRPADEVQEVRAELRRTATIKAYAGSAEVARWHVRVTPDAPPTISLSRPPELTPRGSLKLTYRADDDFGVASAKAILKKAPAPPRDPAKDWSRPAPPKGPRPPLERPPELTLRLPKANAKEASGHTYFELASHPWAGMKVVMTLEATDVAGQVGRSVPFEMILPERQFTKPLARAVAEQRRKLLDDPRYRSDVIKALNALTLEPEGFIDDARVYLGLRSVYHRLGLGHDRAAMRSSVDQLWQIALRIEDGSLSDAERRLKEAQDKLAKALEDGASEEEIKQLMSELRQAFNDFMKQLAEQNGKNGEQPEGQNPDQQSLAQEDLERMMRNLEDLAKNGSREQAQQMLSEMQDLMERLQSGQVDQAQQQRNQEMMQAMEELGDMVGQQQELMDDTFQEQRGGDEKNGGQNGKSQKPPPGLKGLGGDGKQGKGGGPPGKSDRAQQGRGQGGPQGEGQEGQQGPGSQLGSGKQGGGKGGLSERQRELRDRLGKLQQELREKGAAGAGKKLSNAEEAMEAAEQALEDGDFGEATEQQGRALEEMRDGAQSMAQQMLRNMPQRLGQGGDSPRDPLGRPQRSQGPDLGTSVKVPDQIDIQRAREILEELRRRLGETTRGQIELDYLDRLLRRF